MGYINEIGYTNKMGYTNRIDYIGKIGYRIGEVEIGISVVIYKVGFLVILVLVLALAKLFLKK